LFNLFAHSVYRYTVYWYMLASVNVTDSVLRSGNGASTCIQSPTTVCRERSQRGR
jgi:hypothetical protein